MAWALFFTSIAAVAVLCFLGLQDMPPRAVHRPAAPGLTVSTGAAAPLDPTAPGAPAPPDRSVPGVASSAAPALAAASDPQPDASSAGAAARPSPEEFLDELLACMSRGDLEAIAERLSPGAAEMIQGLMPMLFAARLKGGGERLKRGLDALRFELEDMPGGSVRVRAKGPGGETSPLDVYLVPDGDQWRIAAASDLPGAAADQRLAINRLRLLALCQETYVTEFLGGPAAARPDSVRDLAAALDRSPLYAGVVDPRFAAAVDARAPFESYVFGQVALDGGGMGYYAVPVGHGPGPGETLIVDAQGRTWSKDLGGSDPQAAWPGADPAAEGWTRKGN